jgi:L-rhamnose mutarotase
MNREVIGVCNEYFTISIKFKRESMKKELEFVCPKLNESAKMEDVLLAFNQFEEVYKNIMDLKKQNVENYALFVQQHRNIIKKSLPVVGKVYRVVGKDDFDYSWMGYKHIIEYVYVDYCPLKKDVGWADFMPQARCVALSKTGNPIMKEDYRKAYLKVCDLSKESYPEILKSFKSIVSGKENKDLLEYRRLKEKYENNEEVS